MVKDVTDTRQLILHAALKRFADAGYAATSVQHIVDDAKVSKPALYYHFADKAGLFQALVHEAHDRAIAFCARRRKPAPASMSNWKTSSPRCLIISARTGN